MVNPENQNIDYYILINMQHIAHLSKDKKLKKLIESQPARSFRNKEKSLPALMCFHPKPAIKHKGCKSFIQTIS